MKLMRAFAVVVGSAVVAGQVLAVQEDAAKKELTRLQGIWLVHKQLSRGADFPPKKDSKLMIEGATAKAYEEGKLVQTLTIRVDPSKKPTEIDLRFRDKKDEERVVPGIYKLEGDSLTIATGFGREDRQTRPKSFEDKTGLFILILKREKK
jgi:uncharacterized protein (TIGR03067 family)